MIVFYWKNPDERIPRKKITKKTWKNYRFEREYFG